MPIKICRFELFCRQTGFEKIHGFIHPIARNGQIQGCEDIEAIFTQLPKYIQDGGIRESVYNLADIHFRIPLDEHLQRRLFVMLAFIAQVYIRGSGKDTVDVLPSVLSVPLVAIAKGLGVMPIISYASTTQFNVLPFSPETTDDDIIIYGSATGLIDEFWFYKCGVFIERLAPSFIQNVLYAQECLELGIFDRAHEYMISVNGIVALLKPKLMRIREHCVTDNFYNSIRKYLAGWKNDASLPEGVKYEGVEGRLVLPGATAAQSPFIMIVDIVMGIDHSGSSFSQLMLECVPAQDRLVIDYFKKQLSLRTLVENSCDQACNDCFNEIIDNLYAFRDEHLKIVTQYILKPTALLHGDRAIGTGGSDPVSFLAGYKRATMAARIK
jgi:indoleamine 2,3-dioxygenase